MYAAYDFCTSTKIKTPDSSILPGKFLGRAKSMHVDWTVLGQSNAIRRQTSRTSSFAARTFELFIWQSTGTTIITHYERIPNTASPSQNQMNQSQ